MAELKNVIRGEAIMKLKQIAAGEVAMLCTFTSDRGVRARPMVTLNIDDDGTLWFFSRHDSTKNHEIIATPRIHLIYGLPNRSEYLSLDGTARVLHDRVKIEQLWSSSAKAWFPDGKESPHLSLIKVIPTSGHYWDTRHTRMIHFAEVAVRALAGGENDSGIEGAITINP